MKKLRNRLISTARVDGIDLLVVNWSSAVTIRELPVFDGWPTRSMSGLRKRKQDKIYNGSI